MRRTKRYANHPLGNKSTQTIPNRKSTWRGRNAPYRRNDNINVNEEERETDSQREQQKLRGLWNTEVQCSIHKSSPIIPILSRINSIPYTGIYFFKIHANIVRLSTSRPSDLFPVVLPVITLKALLPASVLATWPAPLNHVDVITLITLSERYKLWNSSLWSLLHSREGEQCEHEGNLGRIVEDRQHQEKQF